MSVDITQFHQIFFEEAAEHIAAMEQLLLALDTQNPSSEELNAIFRAAHSIKGGAATFGFANMADFTHVLESTLDQVRNKELPPTTELVDVCLRASDILKEQLAGHQEHQAVDPAAAEAVLLQIQAIATKKTSPPTSSATPTHSKETPPALPSPRFCLTVPAFANIPPDQLLAIQEELSTFGQIEVTSAADGTWQAILQGKTTQEEIRDILSWVLDVSLVSVELLPATDEASYGIFAAQDEDEEGYGFFTPLPETAPSISKPPDDDLGYGFFDPLPTEAPASQITPSVSPELPALTLTHLPPVDKPSTEKSAPVAIDTSIRVSVDKVDQLINLVGELVITHAMLAQSAADIDPVLYQNLHNGMAQLERNSRDLQESVMSIRMLPMSFVFSRFPRLVRDLASKLGKKIELRTEGDSTELDKGMLEKVTDPLNHLVRNSLDHGIELPTERLAAGKTASGTIRMTAVHQGGHIVIEVIDDGKGLDRQKILAKAKERNIALSDNPSDQEVWQLIFAPGFSTAEQVTDVSGRGVGMDVVKRNIEAIGGHVELFSATGIGTRTSIHLPLTLAILDGMSISVGDDLFIIPLANIIESLQPLAQQVKSISGRGRVIQVRDDYLPLLALHEVFALTPKFHDPTQGIIVILSSGSDRIALFVDGLVGQHQVVIKSLETNYRKVRGISGATIMGDGKVALILDVPALLRIGQPNSI